MFNTVPPAYREPTTPRPRVWMVVALIVGVLIVAGGAYYASVYFRVKKILTNDTLLNEALANTAATLDEIDQNAVARGDDSAIKQVADFFSTDPTTVRSSYQFQQIMYIHGLLADYRALYGEYPATFAALEAKRSEITETCRPQSGCLSNKYAQPLSGQGLVDYFTKTPYPYQRTDAGYALTYQMGSCKKDSLCAVSAGIYQNGKNTLTPNDMSLEQTSASDEAAFATSQAIPLDRDSDNDGLTDLKEAQYLTDPNKADSDGDGYPDMTEIQNGYNPNGPGRM